MKNILILITKGPNYYPLFRNIGSFLQDKGFNVIYGLESHYLDYEYNNGERIKNNTTYYFSDYLNEENQDNENIIKKYANSNLYEALIADYNRSVSHYNWWKKKDKESHIGKLGRLVSFYEMLYTKHSIDTVLHECTANEFAYAAYLVSKQNKVQYIGLQAARLPNRIEIHDGPHGPLFRKKIEDVTISNDDQTFIDTFISGIKDVTPFYMKSKFNPANVNYVQEYASANKIRKLLNLVKYRIKYNSTIKYEFGSEKPLAISFALFKRQITRYFKVKRIHRLYDSLLREEKFYIYPVHFEPEASVSVWARFYIDQINFIRTIAFQLPFGSYLYVKDHKSSKGLLSNQFYKEIQLIPNVRFISPEVNTKELAIKAEGIITLTSTLGFEALAMRKRVYIFGDIFFERHPFAVKVPHYRDLFSLLRKDIEKPPVYKDEYDRFFMEYYINTYAGTLDIYNQNEKLFEDIYDAIIDYAKY